MHQIRGIIIEFQRSRSIPHLIHSEIPIVRIRILDMTNVPCSEPRPEIYKMIYMNNPPNPNIASEIGATSPHAFH